jgi:hypothetical protein
VYRVTPQGFPLFEDISWPEAAKDGSGEAFLPKSEREKGKR